MGLRRQPGQVVLQVQALGVAHFLLRLAVRQHREVLQREQGAGGTTLVQAQRLCGRHQAKNQPRDSWCLKKLVSRDTKLILQ